MSQRRSDWPQEIKRVQLANFRPGPADRCGDYLAKIRQVACCTCPENRDIQAHHLRGGEAARHRALGRKPPDWFVVPHCWRCHDEVGNTGAKKEIAWYWARGLDVEQLRMDLWRARAHADWMREVRDNHVRNAMREMSQRAAVNALMRHGLTRAEAEEQYEFTRRGR
jgi:hypothetical protein